MQKEFGLLLISASGPVPSGDGLPINIVESAQVVPELGSSICRVYRRKRPSALLGIRPFDDRSEIALQMYYGNLTAPVRQLCMIGSVISHKAC